MVSAVRHDNQILLLHPTASLVIQAGDWVRHHDRYSLRMASPRELPGVEAALAPETAAVVIDAGNDPQQALRIAALAVERLGRARVFFYSETACPQIDQQAQALGAVVLTGPMSPLEWEAAFDTLRAPQAPEAADIAPRPLPERFIARRIRTAARRAMRPATGPPGRFYVPVSPPIPQAAYG